MTGPRILVAGIGNIFLGDDAFGSEVARRLSGRALPEFVRVVDFGIRGFDLAYALLEDYDAAILVDATSQGGSPGTLYTIELECGGPEICDPEAAGMDAHGMNPMRVLDMVRALGGRPKRILVVGCEPATLGGEQGAMGLSEPVEAAIDGAIALVEALAARIADELREGVVM